MNIPKSIDYLGYTYEVEESIDQVFTDGAASKTCHYEQVIQIHANTNPIRKGQLLLCEMIELVDHMNELELDSLQMVRLSHGLYGLMVENKMFNLKKIPSKIKFMAYTYPVIVDTHTSGNECAFGAVEYIDQEIHLHRDSTPTRKCETLLHECIHIVDYIFKTGLEEKDICSLSHNLHGMMVHNGLMTHAGRK